jgi:hypothetical protein
VVQLQLLLETNQRQRMRPLQVAAGVLAVRWQTLRAFQARQVAAMVAALRQVAVVVEWVAREVIRQMECCGEM